MVHSLLQIVVVVHIVAENYLEHMIVEVDTQNMVVAHVPKKMSFFPFIHGLSKNQNKTMPSYVSKALDPASKVCLP